jgi:nicotinamidase-related amidase
MKTAYGLRIPQTLEEVCDPQRVALLVYDMQVGILSQIKNADEITRQVLKVLTAARKPWFLHDTPGFEIVPELSPRPTEGAFDKLTMSAFEGTWLDFALRDCGINAFIIVGVATEIGIEPTARHGADLGYIPVLVTDACSTGSEDAAKRSIESLKFTGDALITDTETICQVLRK